MKFVIAIRCGGNSSCIIFLASHLALEGNSPPGDPLQQPVRFVAVGESGSIYTSIGKTSEVWTLQNSNTSATLHYVAMLPYAFQGIVFAVGDSGVLIRSADWGETWEKLNSYTSAPLHGYDFFNEHTILAVGDSGTILSAGGPGDSIVHYNAETSCNLRSVIVNDAFIFVVVGEKGTILRTSNSGATWQDYSIADTTVDFTRITRYGYVAYGGRMWAVGTKGAVYSSQDGTAWTQQSSGTEKKINDVRFRNVNEGGVFGDGGLIRYTTDGGDLWESDPFLDSITTENILCMAPVDANTFSVNAGGNILAVSSEPLTDAPPQENITSSFSLEQNYPNPFNPATTFAFSIPAPAGGLPGVGQVSLKIFDMLGQEVATVAEENLSPGYYQRRFDAGGLSSGVYMYRLTVSPKDGGSTSRFVAVKKFVLLK